MQDGDCTRELECKASSVESKFFTSPQVAVQQGQAPSFPLEQEWQLHGRGQGAAGKAAVLLEKLWGCWGSQAGSELLCPTRVSQDRLYQHKEEHHWHETARSTLFPLQTAQRWTTSLRGDVMFRPNWRRLMIGDVARHIQVRQGERAGMATQQVVVPWACTGFSKEGSLGIKQQPAPFSALRSRLEAEAAFQKPCSSTLKNNCRNSFST